MKERLVIILVALAMVAAVVLSAVPLVQSEIRGRNPGQPPEMIVTNLGPGINSDYADFGPVSGARLGIVYFTSNRPGGLGGYDIWRSRLVEGKWTPPENVGPPLNSPDDDIINYHSSSSLYITRKPRRLLGGTSDIYQSKYDIKNRNWSEPEAIGPEINSESDEAGAWLDGYSTLYFVSNRPNSSGVIPNWDIYVSRKEFSKREWSPAENLGRPVNSARDEIWVTVNHRKLIFSSNGFKGQGGFDLFFCESIGQEVTPPRPWGTAINGPGDETSLLTTSSHIDLNLLTRGPSTRLCLPGKLPWESRRGCQPDLFSFKAVPHDYSGTTVRITGIVVDRMTCPPPIADKFGGMPIYDFEKCTPIRNVKVWVMNMEKTVLTETRTDRDGFYKLEFPWVDAVGLTAHGSGYSFYQEKDWLNRSNFDGELERNILLDPTCCAAPTQ